MLHSGPENLKMSRQKNSWNQINQFFFVKLLLEVLNFFPRSKIDFWPFFKLQKMDFCQKKIREIDLFDLARFLAWTFFNFSGLLWVFLPGTSPLANKVFILSKKLESITLDSSRIKQIFSSLHPERLSTCLRSSSKSSAVYLLWTLIWNTDKPFIQATNLDNVVLPEPEVPINNKWPE